MEDHRYQVLAERLLADVLQALGEYQSFVDRPSDER
jgi:hypothetical protein